MTLFMDRSDVEQLLDVEEMARIRLQHSPYRALRKVSCEYANGNLYLRGCVPTFHYKQLAQVTVTGIGNVQRIVNEVEVESDFEHVD